MTAQVKTYYYSCQAHKQQACNSWHAKTLSKASSQNWTNTGGSVAHIHHIFKLQCFFQYIIYLGVRSS